MNKMSSHKSRSRRRWGENEKQLSGSNMLKELAQKKIFHLKTSKNLPIHSKQIGIKYDLSKF